jgi:hypothetical protein
VRQARALQRSGCLTEYRDYGVAFDVVDRASPPCGSSLLARR